MVSQVSPGLTIDEMCKRLDDLAKQPNKRMYQRLGFSGISDKSELSSVAGFILKEIGKNPVKSTLNSDTKKRLIDSFKQLCPRGKPEVMKLVANFIQVVNLSEKSADKEEFVKVHEASQNKFLQTRADFEKLYTYTNTKVKSDCNELRVEAGAALSPNLLKGPLDVNLFIRLLHKLGSAMAIMKNDSLEVSDKVRGFRKISNSIGLMLKSEIDDGFASKRLAQFILDTIGNHTLDLFLKKCLSNPSIHLPGGLFEKYGVFQNSSLTTKVNFERAYRGFLLEIPSVPLKVQSKLSKKSESLKIESAAVTEMKGSAVFQAIEKEDSKGVSDEEIPKSESLDEPELDAALGEDFPYEYSDRVLRWQSAKIGVPLDPELFFEYDSIPDPTVIAYHNFSSLVDRFYKLGKEAVWHNNTTGLDDRLYLIPAEFQFKEETVRGVVGLCIGGADNVCYHRWFQPKNMGQMCDIFLRNVFQDQDFPELNAQSDAVPGVQPIRSANEDTIVMSNNGAYVTIYDANLKANIQLILLDA